MPPFSVVHIKIVCRTICISYSAPSTTTAVFSDKSDDNVKDFDCGARVEHQRVPCTPEAEQEGEQSGHHGHAEGD